MLAVPAFAQEAPGWDEEPYAETLTLYAGFSDDPRTVDVTPGGASANPINGSGCVGYIGYRPDVVVDYASGSFDLTFSAASDTDINLVVRAPNGQYYCDDDSGEGLDPMLTVSNPRSGRYAVWVGVYAESGDYVDGVFGVSEVGSTVSMSDRGGSGQGVSRPMRVTTQPAGRSSSVEIPGWNESPYAGSMRLVHGFSGDPRATDVTPGGSQANPLSGSGCVGYIGLRPDVVVDYDPSSFDLTFSAASDTDINLVVRDPNGRYHCDDDSGEGLDPMLTIRNPARGEYVAWVGVYAESGEYVDGVFGVSELGNAVTMRDRGRSGAGSDPAPRTVAPTPVRTVSSSGRDIDGWSESPYAGSMTLEHGFSGDPRTMNVTPGGSQANPLTGPGCVGYIGLRPDAVVTYTPSSFDLTFSAASDTDINLVVRDPSGQYHCDDDSGEGLNPVLTVDNPVRGRYTVWVGVYGSSGDYVDGVLGVSELGNAVTMRDRGRK